jgi:hypothetical protein
VDPIYCASPVRIRESVSLRYKSQEVDDLGAPPWRTRKYLTGDHILNILFLGAFEKLQKKKKRLLVSSYFSVRPGVRLEQLDSQWTYVHEI